MSAEAKAVILMGVSGCGKTSVGVSLAERTGWLFFDGDAFHPQANLDRMATGIPLSDEDRQPWLEDLHRLIDETLRQGRCLILACSALKRSYREVLRGPDDRQVVFVHLKGSYDLIYSRMKQREGHYMSPEMLRSQFEALEEPLGAIEMDIRKSVPEITQELIPLLSTRSDDGRES